MEKPLISLVTGGAGFIGSHLCKNLIKQGQKVICLDNLLTGSQKNLSDLENNPNFVFIKHDIIFPLDSDILSQIDKINFIYHLASPASPVQYQKYALETLMVNSGGTLNMLNIAQKYHASFLLASTSEVYGEPKMHPQNETYWGNVNPVGPRSCYDEGKRFSEALTMEFIKKERCHGVIARIFNTYGPNMQEDDGRVISNFINQAIRGIPLTVYGDGRQTRSFCYVSDLVEGITKLITKVPSKEKIFNIGNPEEKEVIDIADMIIKLTNSNSKIKYLPKPVDDPTRRKPDITRIHNEIGWIPKVSLIEGLRLTIAYFQDR